MPTCKAPLPSGRPPPLTTVPSPGWRAYVWSAVPGAASSLPSPALVGLVDDLTVRPGLVLNKPPLRPSVVGPRACHNINAYRPFARSGQRADDTLADDAPHLTLTRFYGQQYRHVAGAERRRVGHEVVVPSVC